jgi:phosphatidylserine/phosphatidylglycerophosphate/cardiolipin synthase-like enzyme
MVIDGEVVELGSFNHTAAAEKRNAENALVLHDPAVAQQYPEFWEERSPGKAGRLTAIRRVFCSVAPQHPCPNIQTPVADCQTIFETMP